MYVYIQLREEPGSELGVGGASCGGGAALRVGTGQVRREGQRAGGASVAVQLLPGLSLFW